MTKATILFAIRPWNIGSFLIRWSLPVSRFKWARASHSMILDGDYVIHSTMLHGVSRQPLADVLKTYRIVARRDYDVPDIEAGLAWSRMQVGKKYDFKGAFGISLDPDREWLEDDKWFCHELSAALLHASRRIIFDKCGHVTDTALLMIAN